MKNKKYYILVLLLLGSIFTSIFAADSLGSSENKYYLTDGDGLNKVSTMIMNPNSLEKKVDISVTIYKDNKIVNACKFKDSVIIQAGKGYDFNLSQANTFIKNPLPCETDGFKFSQGNYRLTVDIVCSDQSCVDHKELEISVMQKKQSYSVDDTNIFFAIFIGIISCTLIFYRFK